MATVDTSGDPILITYSVAQANALDFKEDVIKLFSMDPSSSNVQVANRIAQDIRERVRLMRRQDAGEVAEQADPGTIDFT